ncbi:immunoglobulin lambda-1 light chain-like isoform X1, partial [Silurus asotus]
MTLIPVFIWTLILWTQGETVTINCKTNPAVYYHGSYGHYLHWYQQKAGEAPKLLVKLANQLQSGFPA